MQIMPPKEIREAHKACVPWLIYSSKDEQYVLKEDAPEEIKKLNKKCDDWWEKNYITFD